MTDDTPGDRAARDDAASAAQAASEVAAMVAQRVRAALEAAEHEAAEIRRQALERARDDRAAVHEAAEAVTTRLDAIEADVIRMLGELRDEVSLIVAEAERAALRSEAGSHDRGSRRRRGRLRRPGRFRRGRAQAVLCGVCGTTADAESGELERWERTAATSLCPQCQAAGWRIPEGATVPQRLGRHHLQT